VTIHFPLPAAKETAGRTRGVPALLCAYVNIKTWQKQTTSFVNISEDYFASVDYWPQCFIRFNRAINRFTITSVA